MNVSDLQQSRQLGKGKAAQTRAALFGRKTTDCQRPTLSPREERVGREPERGDGFQKNVPPLPGPLLRLRSEERELTGRRRQFIRFRLPIHGTAKLCESFSRAGGFPNRLR